LPTLPEPRAGEIWDVRLGPGISPEQTGLRPSLVISGDWFNVLENYLVFAVPITGTDRGLNYQVKISGREGGLSKNSVIMCEQARAISVMRCVRKRGDVTEQTLATVQRIVTAILNKSPV